MQQRTTRVRFGRWTTRGETQRRDASANGLLRTTLTGLCGCIVTQSNVCQHDESAKWRPRNDFQGKLYFEAVVLFLIENCCFCSGVIFLLIYYQACRGKYVCPTRARINDLRFRGTYFDFPSVPVEVLLSYLTFVCTISRRLP